jgi:hypothetical protein
VHFSAATVRGRSETQGAGASLRSLTNSYTVTAAVRTTCCSTAKCNLLAVRRSSSRCTTAKPLCSCSCFVGLLPIPPRRLRRYYRFRHVFFQLVSGFVKYVTPATISLNSLSTRYSTAATADPLQTAKHTHCNSKRSSTVHALLLLLPLPVALAALRKLAVAGCRRQHQLLLQPLLLLLLLLLLHLQSARHTDAICSAKISCVTFASVTSAGAAAGR